MPGKQSAPLELAIADLAAVRGRSQPQGQRRSGRLVTDNAKPRGPERLADREGRPIKGEPRPG